MKKRYLILLIILIFFLIPFSLFQKNIPYANASSNDLIYEFDNDNIFNENKPFSNTTFNMKNQTIYTQHYNATYSFKDEIDGTTDLDIDFINYKYSTDFYSKATIIGENNNHKKVINTSISGEDGKYGLWLNYFIPYQPIGGFEYWMAYVDNGVGRYVVEGEGEEGADLISLRFMANDNKFYVFYGSGSGVATVSIDAFPNIWYHIKVEFNCITDKHSVWFNQELLLDNQNFYADHVADNLERYVIKLDQGGGLNSLECYIDAIGYSWDIIDFYNIFYSFDNEIGLQDTEISWVNYIKGTDSGSLSEVITESEERNTPIKFITNGDVVKYVYWQHNITTYKIGGIIEFYFKYTDKGTGHHRIWFYDSEEQRLIECHFYSITNEFTMYYGDGEGSFTTAQVEALSNIWYHINISWNCYTNKFSCWFNGNLLVDNENFYQDMDGEPLVKYQIYLDNGGGSNSLECHIDSINETFFISYEPGNNIIPYLIINTSIQEVDKCEFAYNITNFEPNFTEYKTINNNWNEIDYDNLHIQTGIYSEGEISIDYLDDHTYQFGIEKEFNYNNDGIYNISLTIYMLDLYLDTKGFNFNIYTYDDTLLVSLRIALDTPTSKVYYYDGSSYIYLYSINDGYSNDLIFNIYIDSFCILELIEISESINTFYFPKLTSKIGINTIEFIGDILSSNSMSIFIKSIGFYINGTSYLPHDLSSLTINTNIDNWNDNIHNLFYINADGSFSFSVEYDDIVEAIIFPLTYFNNELKVFHYVNSEIFKGSQPYSFLILTNSTYQINTIQISTVILKQDINEYFMEFDFQGIDANESYFYVIGNRLYFTLNVKESEQLECMNASFNIKNVYSTSRSISFHSYFNGDSLGIFGVNYLGNKSRFFLFPNYQDSVNIVLHQGKTIDRFTIYITDNNYNYSYGISSGYISNIKLIYLPDIEFTMLTTILITMMIPLIIILVPTIAIYVRFGKNLIVPMIILMSLICFIGNLIPAELFFIIMFGCSALVIGDRRRGE